MSGRTSTTSSDKDKYQDHHKKPSCGQYYKKGLNKEYQSDTGLIKRNFPEINKAKSHSFSKYMDWYYAKSNFTNENQNVQGIKKTSQQGKRLKLQKTKNENYSKNVDSENDNNITSENKSVKENKFKKPIFLGRSKSANLHLPNSAKHSYSSLKCGPFPETTTSLEHPDNHKRHLNISSFEEDHDSGIVMNTLLNNADRRHPITDKKSIFSIAYDDVRVTKIIPYIEQNE